MAWERIGQFTWRDNTTGQTTTNDPTPKAAPAAPAPVDPGQAIVNGAGFGYDAATAAAKLKAAGLDPAKYQDAINKQIQTHSQVKAATAQHGMTDSQIQAANLGHTQQQQAAAQAAAADRARKEQEAQIGAAKLQAQRAASPSNQTGAAPVAVSPDLKLTPSEAKATNTPTNSNQVTQTPIVNQELEQMKEEAVKEQTPAAPEAPKAPTMEAPKVEEPPKVTPAGESDWMKDLYGEWKKAYGKESGYRDTLMGGVAGQSYDPAKAMQFAQGQAKEQAARDTDAASRQAIKAARTAGINPAQAALIAGQKTSDVYGQAMNSAQQQALQQYNQSIQAQQQAASLTGGMQNQLLPNAVGLKQSEAANALAQAQMGQQAGQNNMDFWGRILGGFAPLGAGLLASDERVKDNVKTVSYTYKGSNRPEMGVLAQDLEKTPLSTSVVEGPGGVKMIDTKRLTTQNTAMIADLARKVDKIASKFGG
jgi:hypothetical protein